MAEVVEGGEADDLSLGLYDERLYGWVLPAGEVVAAGGGEGDLDGRTAVPGGEVGVAVPLVGLLDVVFAGVP